MTQTQKLFSVLSMMVIFVCIGSAALFAAGNKEAPQIQVKTSGPQYLSPNGDGVKDSADLSFSVTLRVKSQKGFVPEYGLSIENAGGTAVRTIQKTEKSDINWFVRIFTGYKSFTLTKTITWDGKNDAGQVVPDGTYKARLYVVDANGNRQTADLNDFIVDTRPPTASINAPNGLLFSPNGDGNMDTLQIDQSGDTSAATWTGTFTNSSGNVVRTMKWENSTPKSFAWDGKGETGTVVANGNYTYTLAGVDLAGNKSKDYRITGISVDTTRTAVTVSLSEPYISPNGDGVKDSTLITLSTASSEKIASWALALDDASGTAVRRIEGKGAFPGSVPFDGKSASGAALPNGRYMVVLSATLRNGNVETSRTPLVINTTPPQLHIALSNPYFSPNGDGVKDATTASFTLSSANPVDNWALALLSGDGTVLAQQKGTGNPPKDLTWDGKDRAGNPAPQGTYTVRFAATLVDGTSSTATAPVTVDTTPPVVRVMASSPIFTPNSSDSRNTEVISYTSNEPVTWRGSLADSAGRELLSTPGPESVRSVSLDRSVPAVASAPDGLYKLELTFTDRAGNSSTASPVSISLIAKPPTTTVVAAPAFSPNGDGVADTLGAKITTTAYAPVTKWDIAVLDSGGQVVADYPGTGSLPTDFRWNGIVGQQSGSNVIAPDGGYTLRLTVNYDNGIIWQAASNSFQLDTKPPAVAATADPGGFVVNGQGLEGRVDANVEVKDADPIASWSIDILNPNGSLLKSYSGHGNPSQRLTWRGTLPIPGNAPTEVSRYPYGVRMTATDSVGNSATVTARVAVEAIAKMRSDGKIQMLVPNVLFGVYKYALDSRSPEQGAENLRILHRVAALLQKYTSYNLEVDGYSMEIYEPGTPEYAREEAIIIPLSKNRSETVRNALINMGLAPGRVIARHFGGLHPLVDPLNVPIRWRNRRVEFILLPR